MEDKKNLKRKRSDSFKNNSIENLYSNKIFKGDKNSSNKKRFVQNGHNKKKYNYNDTYLKASDKTKIVYPNHFWFGGSNNDPLNLNGLNDSEEISHHITSLPSSPLTSPHRHDVLVPVAHAVNIYDPLNLCGEEEDDLFFKKRNRTRKRRHSTKKSRSKSRLNSLSDEGNTEGNLSTGSEKTSSELSCFKVNLLSSSENINKISNCHLSDPNYLSKTTLDKFEPCENLISKKESESELQRLKCSTTKQHKVLITPNSTQSRNKNVYYQHGNYNTFTNYLHPDLFDSHLETLPKSTFEGMDVMDIGCGVGHCSILLALKLGARSVVGVDIDAKLIQAANKNLRYAANKAHSNLLSNKIMPHSQSNISPSSNIHLTSNNISKKSFLNNNTHILLKSIYPSTSHSLMNFDFKAVNSLSSRINSTHEIDVKGLYESQATEAPTISKQSMRNLFKTFPHNVTFTQQDYIPLSNLEVDHITPQYDVIIALSLTKYIHLNYGDKGLKLMFRKMFKSLRYGGMLLLQAHHWISYKKHQHRTEHTSNNYKKIKFFPWQFEQYLLNLGFSMDNHLNHFRFTHKHKASHQFMLQLKKSHASINVSSINHPLPLALHSPHHHQSHNKSNVCIIDGDDGCKDDDGDDDDGNDDDRDNRGYGDDSVNSVVSNVDSSSLNAFDDEDDDDLSKCHDDDDLSKCHDDVSKCNEDEVSKCNDDDDVSKCNDNDVIKNHGDDDVSKCNGDDCSGIQEASDQ